jgi:hypothetical protein
MRCVYCCNQFAVVANQPVNQQPIETGQRAMKAAVCLEHDLFLSSSSSSTECLQNKHVGGNNQNEAAGDAVLSFVLLKPRALLKSSLGHQLVPSNT